MDAEETKQLLLKAAARCLEGTDAFFEDSGLDEETFLSSTKAMAGRSRQPVAGVRANFQLGYETAKLLRERNGQA